MGPGPDGFAEADGCPEEGGEPPGEAKLVCIVEGGALLCSSPRLLGASPGGEKLAPWVPGVDSWSRWEESSPVLLARSWVPCRSE